LVEPVAVLVTTQLAKPRSTASLLKGRTMNTQTATLARMRVRRLLARATPMVCMYFFIRLFFRVCPDDCKGTERRKDAEEKEWFPD
jgi:hypothetical protein